MALKRREPLEAYSAVRRADLCRPACGKCRSATGCRLTPLIGDFGMTVDATYLWSCLTCGWETAPFVVVEG